MRRLRQAGVVTVASRHARRIAAAARDLDPAPDPVERSRAEWADLASAVAPALPSGLVRAVRQFGVRGRAGRTLVVRGLPVDADLQATPGVASQEMGGAARRGVLTALAVLNLLGEPHPERDSTPWVHHLTPALEPRHDSGPHATTPLWRVENLWSAHRCHHLAMLCLRGHPTVLTASAAALDLDPRWERVLRAPRFVPGGDGSGANGDQHPAPVLSGPAGDPEIRYHSLFLRPYDPEDVDAAAALRHLTNELTRVTLRHVLEPGDLLLLDNRRTVHAHPAVSIHRDGADWWLARVTAFTTAGAAPPEIPPTTDAREVAPKIRPRIAPETAPKITPGTTPEIAPEIAPRATPKTRPKIRPVSRRGTVAPPRETPTAPVSVPSSPGPPVVREPSRPPGNPAPTIVAPAPARRPDLGVMRPACSHDEFSPLVEVVVGTAANARLPNLVRDPSAWLGLYPELTARELERIQVGRFPPRVVEESEEDLDTLARMLWELGVVVHRPVPVDHELGFVTPHWGASGFHSYCPRDLTLVLGTTIIETPSLMRARYHELAGLRPLFRRYMEAGSTWIAAPRPELRNELFGVDGRGRPTLGEAEPVFDAANVLRCGRDLFYQVSVSGNEAGFRWLRAVAALLGDYRVHPLRGLYPYTHIDTTLMLVRPGLVVANPAYVSERTLPAPLRRWDVLWCPPPVEAARPATPWPTTSPWIGMNLLMVAPDLAIVDAAQHKLIRLLERRGVHVLPHTLRHARVLGGGHHCVTLDTVRAGDLNDYCS
ncbi:N-Dimethylarginine dimethylaminohydrolase [Streptoalloteichus tenebrarius]|uniref:N-Dimethylarginine dimethylaminohydrolase n=1 Tax=Streptoalloteichus tenebrarius (strain ATCC 17920 / DSM 40477 / JCM 4838 / CBS 697.72 / NBRC 16177 / NCIMB 11028 / NRRL B-12390 / A12253. 1 / ISP 5477) TaxID=1933 RepID=A0ABT1I1J2_STRSD|nr:TauD/TfdA family dioxygenase [Streptoalloteichus tenebrarius]MCP2261616.1 N-Dimethylarginine dimethylaminohydrolase [Streptoalloteichus tenebrarius]BFE99383.1 hypothetical protein GCM10020241_10590 [Streptoalloteichus tenebrarius]